MELLGHKVVLLLILGGPLCCFPYWPRQFTVPPAAQGPPFSLRPCRHRLLFDSVMTATDGYEAAAHCGFDVHYPDDERRRASCAMSIGHLHILFGEMSIQVLCPFFNQIFFFLVLSHLSSLYISDINPLSDVSLANIFS
uniref:Uncharacterized protein n=1 Tax=Rousettus aegyptiacus TaxID=9407 RepID=A0A7J8C2B0_ROUAE|nr:hypothetical protein HJG63_009296 [Rousettus aegyptiacus]